MPSSNEPEEKSKTVSNIIDIHEHKQTMVFLKIENHSVSSKSLKITTMLSFFQNFS